MSAEAIHTIVFVSPQRGVTLANAVEALTRVLESGSATSPLRRIVLTSQDSNSATTDWSSLCALADWCLANNQPNVRVFSNLAGLKQKTAAQIADRGIFLTGEWSSSDFGPAGLEEQTRQFGRDRAASMLAGIRVALREGALRALEFQVTASNIRYAEAFIRTCKENSIDFHFEMRELPCRSDAAPDKNRQMEYVSAQPEKTEIKKLARLMAAERGHESAAIVPPFFQMGGPLGACEYIRGGIFLRPARNGDLVQTVCLSNWSRVTEDFLGEADPVATTFRHPIVRANMHTAQREMDGACKVCRLWENCRGGCRSMSYLATGSLTEPDPNCWHE